MCSPLENGRRAWVGVAELAVLARALNTAPVALLYPDRCAEEVEMLPGLVTTGPFALQWFSGFIDGPARAPASDDGAEYTHNMLRVRIARRIWELQECLTALMKAELRAGADERSMWVDRIADVERRIDVAMQEYRDAG